MPRCLSHTLLLLLSRLSHNFVGALSTATVSPSSPTNNGGKGRHPPATWAVWLWRPRATNYIALTRFPVLCTVVVYNNHQPSPLLMPLPRHDSCRRRHILKATHQKSSSYSSSSVDLHFQLSSAAAAAVAVEEAQCVRREKVAAVAAGTTTANHPLFSSP